MAMPWFLTLPPEASQSPPQAPSLPFASFKFDRFYDNDDSFYDQFETTTVEEAFEEGGFAEFAEAAAAPHIFDQELHAEEQVEATPASAGAAVLSISAAAPDPQIHMTPRSVVLFVIAVLF